MTTRDDGDALLRKLTGNPSAAFRDGQWEAIEGLVERRGRALVVQRTGWGKSAVYFVATRLLRDRGAAPTVLVSPLRALTRKQIQMAERAGPVLLAKETQPSPRWAPNLWGSYLTSFRCQRPLAVRSHRRTNWPWTSERCRTAASPFVALVASSANGFWRWLVQ